MNTITPEQEALKGATRAALMRMFGLDYFAADKIVKKAVGSKFPEKVSPK